MNWVYSLRNWVDDWRGPRWLLPLLSLKSTLALTVFTAWDMRYSFSQWYDLTVSARPRIVKPADDSVNDRAERQSIPFSPPCFIATATDQFVAASFSRRYLSNRNVPKGRMEAMKACRENVLSH